MGLTKPDINVSEPFADRFKEGEPFRLLGIRVVTARAKDYGEGEMVLLKVAGQEKELSIWGQYLTEQARAAESSDFGKDYKIVRTRIEGYSDREVKALVPADDEPGF